MKFILTILSLIISFNVLAQQELNKYKDCKVKVVLDTIIFDSFWDTNIRIVKVNAFLNDKLLYEIKMTSESSDNPYELIDLTIYNYKLDLRKGYIWRPYYGQSYLGLIVTYSENYTIKESYDNYPDESVKRYVNNKSNPKIEKDYIQSEYILDLNIAKSFPEYFKKLHITKYSAIKEQ